MNSAGVRFFTGGKLPPSAQLRGNSVHQQVAAALQAGDIRQNQFPVMVRQGRIPAAYPSGGSLSAKIEPPVFFTFCAE